MKKLISIVLLIFLIASMSIISEAEASSTTNIPFSLKASQSVVEGEDIFTITLFTNADSGLISGKFYVMYDKTVFERYTAKDAVGKLPMGGDAFGSTILNDDTAGITYLTLANDTAKNGTDMYTLGFKVKAGVVSQSYVFKIGIDDRFGVAISDGTDLGFDEYFYDDDFVLTDTSIKVKVFSTITEIEVGPDILFNISITDCPDSGIIYAAVYDGTVLKACSEKKFTSALENAKITVGKVAGDIAKVFIWDANGVPLLKTPEIIYNIQNN